jgi:hypothetical protein
MKTLYAVLVTLTICLPVMGQKPTKEEKQNAKLEENRKKNEPASVTIKATLEAVKAELIRERLADGYQLATDQPSQMTFSQPVNGKLAFFGKATMGRGTSMKNMLQFTFAQSPESVTVYGLAWVAILNRDGVEEHPQKQEKENKPAMMKYLNKIKQTVEH